MARPKKLGFEDGTLGLEDDVLSKSINQISKRPALFQEVVEYLEGDYVTSRNDPEEKQQLVDEAKRYIVQGMAAMLSDIETAAYNLESRIDECSVDVNALANEAGLLQNRLNFSKDRHLLFALDEMKRSSDRHDSRQAVEEDAAEEGEDTLNRKRYLALLESKKAALSFEQRVSDLSIVGVGSSLGDEPEDFPEL